MERNLPAPIEITRLTDEREDHSAEVAKIEKALRQLRFRKQDGDEIHADKLVRRLEWLRGMAG